MSNKDVKSNVSTVPKSCTYTVSTPTSVQPPVQLTASYVDVSADVSARDAIPSPPPSDGKHVSSGSEASDDKQLTPVKPSSSRIRGPGIPLSFLKQLADCIGASSLSECTKSSCLASLLGAADSAMRAQAESAAANADGRPRHGGALTASFDKNRYYFSSLTGSCAYNNNGFATLAGVYPLFHPYVGDEWNNLDPSAIAAKVSRMCVHVCLYPNTAQITGVVAARPSQPYDQYTGLFARVMLIRDKFSIAGNQSYIESAATLGAGPESFNAVLFSPIQTGSYNPISDVNSMGVMTMLHSNLTVPTRYNILYDKVHHVAEPMLGVFTTGTTTHEWRTKIGDIAIDLKLDDTLLFPNTSITNQATPYFDDYFLVIVCNYNTYYSTNAPTLVPNCIADVQAWTEYKAVYPDS